MARRGRSFFAPGGQIPIYRAVSKCGTSLIPSPGERVAAKLTGVEFGRKRYNLQRILDFLKFAVAAFHPLPFGHPPPREGVLKGADEFKTAR